MKERPTPLPGGAISRPLGNIKERLGTGLPTNRFFSAELLLVWPEMQFKGEKNTLGHASQSTFFLILSCFLNHPTLPYLPLQYRQNSHYRTASSGTPRFLLSPFSCTLLP